MSASESKIKAVEGVQEWTRQIMTLSTGTLVLSGLFIKDVFDRENLRWEGFIFTSWVALFVALTFGVFVLGAVSHHLNKTDPDSLDIYSAPILLTAGSQQIAFLIGVAAFGLFAWKNL